MMLRLLYTLICLLFIMGCKEKYTPKPYGYYRIDFPEKTWKPLTNLTLPYNFKMAQEAIIEPYRGSDTKPGWINISYPQYNAKIHITYKQVKTDSVQKFTEECHRLAYEHSIKAESINEKGFKNDHLFGLIYFIEGNTASSTQFYATDSSDHFIHGALYFNQHPDKDSLAPVINYLRKDIINLMETIQFK